MTDPARTSEEDLEELREACREAITFLEERPDRPLEEMRSDHPFRQIRRLVPPRAPEAPRRQQDVIDADRVIRTASKGERLTAALVIDQLRREARGAKPRRVVAGTSR